MGDPPIFFGAVRAGDPPSNSHLHFPNGTARCPNSGSPAFTIFGCGLYLEPAQNRCGPEIKVRNPALEKNIKDGAPKVQIQMPSHPAPITQLPEAFFL
jgi:hypothetical protein